MSDYIPGCDIVTDLQPVATLGRYLTCLLWISHTHYLNIIYDRLILLQPWINQNSPAAVSIIH